jgi:membrane-associated phospholipid phosphatase
MPSGWKKDDSRVRFSLRLEDLVAISFFLIYLIVFAIFGGPGKDLPVWQVIGSGVLAVGLLLSVVLVRQAISAKSYSLQCKNDRRNFVLPYASIIRDWLPFLTILAMYYSLWGDATHILVPRDRDAALIAWDQRLFGMQASVALQRYTHPILTAWMKFAYNFHPFNVPLVGLFIYLRRPRANFREMMSGLMVICFFGYLGYLLVPAVGPLYTLKNQYYIDLGSMQFMDYVKIRRDVFPSLHVGISFLVWIYAYRNSRWLFWILSPLILSLWISTVYLRQHYLIDVVVGLALAPLCVLLADWLFKHYGDVQFSFSIPMN